MAKRTWKFPFLDIFKAEVSGVGGTPDQYLKLSAKCIEYVQKMNSIQFNHEQCKYLAYNLKIVVRQANSFLKRINLNGGSFLNSSPQVAAKVLEIFKLLFTLAKEVECFIKDCCKDAWIQAAVALTNESERVLSMTFNLRLSEMIFSDNDDWGATQAEVGNLWDTELKNVKMKASVDKENLEMKLRTSLKLNKLNSEEHELAIFLLRKLHLASDAEGSSQRNFFERDIMNLRRVRRLGKGAAAVVYQTAWLGMDVAMKTFDGPNNAEFKEEVSNLVGLCHSNITGLLCYGENDRECSIIMELMDEDLAQMMRNILHDNKGSEVPFTILEAIGMMLQIAQGMYYLHEMKIVHRDLKAANILVRFVKAEGVCCVQAKVADFGMSRTKETSKTNSFQKFVVGTSRWMAPEVINCRTDGNKVDNPFKSDVYSFAMVCYEILTGNLPFPTTRQGDVWKKVLAGHRPDLPMECPEELSNLITKCWSAEASMRPDFGDICVALMHLKCVSLLRCKRLSNDLLDLQTPPSRDSEIYVHDGGIIFELADFGTSSSLDWSQFMRFSPELEEALPKMRRSHLLLLKNLLQLASASNQAYLHDLRPNMWIRTIIRLHSHGVKKFDSFRNMRSCLNSDQIEQLNATISVHSNVMPCYPYRSRLQTLGGGRVKSPIKREYFPSAFLDETLSTEMSLMEKLKKGKGEQFPFDIQVEEGDTQMTPRQSLWEIAPSDVKLQKLINEGGSSDVWEIVWQGGHFVRKDFRWEEGFHRELEVAGKVSHPNIVYIVGGKQLSLFMELLDFNLSFLINNKLRLRSCNRPPFSPKGSIVVLLQITKAMAYLHDMDILHMNLTPRKILLRDYEILGDENQFLVKVAGFSSAKVVKPISSSSFQVKEVKGTTHYAAPEVLAARYDKTVEIQHPKKIDIYNFGSVAYKILTGFYPYEDFYEHGKGLTPSEIKKGVIGGTLRPCLREACSRPNFWNDVDLMDLIESCWHHNPQDRPSFSAVLDGLERIQKKLLEQAI